MAMLVKAIPTILMHVFVPLLGVCLAAWFVVLLAPFLAKQVRPVLPLFGRGKRVPPLHYVVIFAVMAVCTLFSDKNTNGVQNLPPRPMLQLPAPLPAPEPLPAPFPVSSAP